MPRTMPRIGYSYGYSYGYGYGYGCDYGYAQTMWEKKGAKLIQHGRVQITRP